MPMADQERLALGMPDLPVVAVAHPLGGERPERMLERAEHVVDAIAGFLTSRGGLR
jgi:hypothetical protein